MSPLICEALKQDSFLRRALNITSKVVQTVVIETGEEGIVFDSFEEQHVAVKSSKFLGMLANGLNLQTESWELAHRPPLEQAMIMCCHAIATTLDSSFTMINKRGGRVTEE